MLDYFNETSEESWGSPYSGMTGTKSRGTGYGLDALRGKIASQPRRVLPVDTGADWLRAYLGDSLAVAPEVPSRMRTGKQAGPEQYQPAQAPYRFTLSPFDTSTGQNELLTGPLGVGFGLAPGQQRGGTIPFSAGPVNFGVATTPVTMQNFASYAREGVLSVITSALGHKYQQPDAFAGQFAAEGPQNTQNLLENIGEGDFEGTLDNMIDGIIGVADGVFGVVDGITKNVRDALAIDRARNVQRLFRGEAPIPNLMDWVTTNLFSGGDKYKWDVITARAAEQGISQAALLATMWDLSPELVAAIEDNPQMTEDQLMDVARGQPLSYDPVVNLVGEIGMMGALFLIPGMAAPRLAAFGRGVAVGARGVTAGLDAMPPVLGPLVAGSGWGSRGLAAAAWGANKATWTMGKVWQANKLLLASGTAVRAGEWGIKQMAEFLGNDELVATMDRWLWETPLSSHPGLQIIDAFSAHPIGTLKAIRAGRVDLGLPGGQTRMPWGPVKVRVGGTDVPISARTARDLGRLNEVMTLDSMQSAVFDKLGWKPELIKAVFANEASTLTANDLANTLVYFALAEARRRAGGAAALEGLDQPTVYLRSEAWVKAHMVEAVQILSDTFAGKDDSIIKLLKEEWWERGGAMLDEASPQGAAGYIGPYDDVVAFANFQSWVAASKRVAEAIADTRVRPDTVVGLRGDVNVNFVSAFRRAMERRYPNGSDVVSVRDLNLLKVNVPTIGQFGRGLIARRGASVPKVTRDRLFAILDEAEKWQADINAKAAAPPTEKVGVIAPDKVADPAAIAKGTGIPGPVVKAISEAEAAPDAVGRVPESVLAWLARQEKRPVDELRAQAPEEVWARIMERYNRVVEEAAARGVRFDAIERFGKWIESRVSLGAIDAAGMDAVRTAVANIKSYLTNPPTAEIRRAAPEVGEAYDLFLSEVDAVAGRVTALLGDPARRLVVVESLDRGGFTLTVEGVGARELDALNRMIAKAVSAQPPELDLAILQSPDVHPFEKAALVANAAEEKRLTLTPLEQTLAERLAPGLDVYAPHVAEVLGPDVPVSREVIDGLTARGAKIAAEADALRTDIKGLGLLADSDADVAGISTELIEVIDNAAFLMGEQLSPTSPGWRGLVLPRSAVDVPLAPAPRTAWERRFGLPALMARAEELVRRRSALGSADLARAIREGDWQVEDSVRGAHPVTLKVDSWRTDPATGMQRRYKAGEVIVEPDPAPGFGIGKYGQAEARRRARDEAARISAETGEPTAYARVGSKFVVYRKAPKAQLEAAPPAAEETAPAPEMAPPPEAAPVSEVRARDDAAMAGYAPKPERYEGRTDAELADEIAGMERAVANKKPEVSNLSEQQRLADARAALERRAAEAEAPAVPVEEDVTPEIVAALRELAPDDQAGYDALIDRYGSEEVFAADNRLELEREGGGLPPGEAERPTGPMTEVVEAVKRRMKLPERQLQNDYGDGGTALYPLPGGGVRIVYRIEPDGTWSIATNAWGEGAGIITRKGFASKTSALAGADKLAREMIASRPEPPRVGAAGPAVTGAERPTVGQAVTEQGAIYRIGEITPDGGVVVWRGGPRWQKGDPLFVYDAEDTLSWLPSRKMWGVKRVPGAKPRLTRDEWKGKPPVEPAPPVEMEPEPPPAPEPVELGAPATAEGMAVRARAFMAEPDAIPEWMIPELQRRWPDRTERGGYRTDDYVRRVVLVDALDSLPPTERVKAWQMALEEGWPVEPRMAAGGEALRGETAAAHLAKAQEELRAEGMPLRSAAEETDEWAEAIIRQWGDPGPNRVNAYARWDQQAARVWRLRAAEAWANEYAAGSRPQFVVVAEGPYVGIASLGAQSLRRVTAWQDDGTVALQSYYSGKDLPAHMSQPTVVPVGQVIPVTARLLDGIEAHLKAYREAGWYSLDDKRLISAARVAVSKGQQMADGPVVYRRAGAAPEAAAPEAPAPEEAAAPTAARVLTNPSDEEIAALRTMYQTIDRTDAGSIDAFAGEVARLVEEGRSLLGLAGDLENYMAVAADIQARLRKMTKKQQAAAADELRAELDEAWDEVARTMGEAAVAERTPIEVPAVTSDQWIAPPGVKVNRDAALAGPADRWIRNKHGLLFYMADDGFLRGPNEIKPSFGAPLAKWKAIEKATPRMAGLDAFVARWLASRLPPGDLSGRLIAAADRFEQLADSNWKKKVNGGPAYDQEAAAQAELDVLIPKAREALMEPTLFGAEETAAQAGYVVSANVPSRGERVTFRSEVDAPPDVEATYRLVELDSLLTSDLEGYPSALQLRQRGRVGQAARVESEQQIDKMARSFRADDALRAENGWEGSPIVRESDVAVVSGNGRVNAMRRMDDAAWANYRAKLVERAREFGFSEGSVNAYRRPVLVREIPDAVATPDLARKLNLPTGGATLSERASAVATEITAEDLARLDISEKQVVEAALRTTDGAKFVQRVFGKLTATEQRGLISNGELTAEGIRLIKTAMLSKVIPDGRAVTRLVDSADDSPIGKIRNGLMESIGQLSTAIALIEEGARFPNLTIAPDLARIVTWLDEVRGAKGDPLVLLGLKPNEYGVTGGTQTGLVLTRDELSAQQRWLAEVLWKLGGPEGSAKQVREFLQAYANRVRGSDDPRQASLFGMEPELEGMLRDVVDDVNATRLREAEGGLFAAADVARDPLPYPPNRAGDTPLAGAAETEGGEMRSPVMASQPVMDEAGLAAEVATRLVGNEPLRITMEPEQIGSSLIDQLERHPEATWTTGDDGLDRAMEGVLKDAPAVRRDYDRLVAEYAAMTEIDRNLMFAELLDLANDPRMKLLTPAQFLLLRELAGGALRRAADGRYNPTRQTFVRDLDLKGRQLIDLVQILNLRHPGKLRIERVAGVAGDAEIVRGPHVEVDAAEYRATTGMEPDMTAVEAEAKRLADSPAHVVMSSENRPVAAAVVKARGGSETLPDGTRLLEVNKPDEARLLAALDEQVRDAQARIEAIESKVEEELATPRLARSTTTLDPAMDDLWQRLMRAQDPLGDVIGVPPPRTLGDVVDAIESIDRGMFGELTAGEAAEFRATLLAWTKEMLSGVNAKQAAERATVRTGQVRKAGPSKTAEGKVTWTPAAVPDELAALGRELGSAVRKDATLPELDGFDRTQYVLTTPPKTGKVTGQPIAPRLFWREDLLEMADRIVPGLADELTASVRRKSMWQRLRDSHVGMSVEWLVGARPEQTIRAQTLANFEERLLGEAVDALSPPEYKSFQLDVKAIYRAWRQEQEQHKLVQYPVWRKISVMDVNTLDKVAERALKERHAGELPKWYSLAKVRPSEAWRQADNRLRNFIRGSGEGDLARMVDTFYDSRGIKRLAGIQRGIIPLYYVMRFIGDARWLALEFTEAPFLAAGRGGFGAVTEGLRGVKREPFLFGRQAQEAAREAWAHWMSVTDTGAMFRLRDRFLIATLRREQPERLIGAMLEMAKNDAELSQTLRRFGDTPEQWLQRLDRDWQALMAKSRPVSAREARSIYQPFLDDGIIDQLTFDRLVEARRYTPVKGIEDAIAESAGDPRIQRLYRALEVKNNELWNELASVFYGQADRSNLQRLLNHPLLYWPISYQIKATKWLANILFDRAFGVDTGSAGAWLIADMHQRHQELMSSDPEYAQFFADNKTLLFMAQMILPITPFDIGVSMSPWTRLVLEGMAANPDDPNYEQPYSRNIFGVGPGYTYFALLPRLIREQQNESGTGRILGGVFGEGGPLSDASRYFPYTIPVKPSGRSQLQQLDLETIQGTGVVPDQELLNLTPEGASRWGP